MNQFRWSQQILVLQLKISTIRCERTYWLIDLHMFSLFSEDIAFQFAVLGGVVMYCKNNYCRSYFVATLARAWHNNAQTTKGSKVNFYSWSVINSGQWRRNEKTQMTLKSLFRSSLGPTHHNWNITQSVQHSSHFILQKCAGMLNACCPLMYLCMLLLCHNHTDLVREYSNFHNRCSPPHINDKMRP